LVGTQRKSGESWRITRNSLRRTPYGRMNRVLSRRSPRLKRNSVAASRVFVSHSGKDKVFAQLVAGELRRANLDPWIDSDKILVGDDVLEGIGYGLRTMDLLILVVSRDALKSPWVDRELRFASKRTIKDKEIRILPFIVDDTPPDALPWHLNLLHTRRVTPDLAGAKDACHQIAKVLQRRARPSLPGASEASVFKGDAGLDALIRPVKLGDWNVAEIAAIDIVKRTDASGRNKFFEILLDYQDFSDEDPRLWGALHTIECCVRLAPWLIEHRMISRMANHENFSVRSSAASICMDLANSAPDRVPFDLLIKLSSYDEDWYVETPANSALKAMARSFPAVLRLFFQRLRSTSQEEREHAANAIRDIASKEPEILNVEDLENAMRHLLAIDDSAAGSRLAEAISRVRTIDRKPRYLYGF
jgi:hypothetical protein